MFNCVYYGNITKAFSVISNRVSSRVHNRVHSASDYKIYGGQASLHSCRYGTASHSEATMSLPSENSNIPESMPNLKSFSEIPGPKGLPVIGTLWEYVKDDGHKFSKMFEVMQQRAETYGPIYKEKIGPETLVTISDPHEYLNVMRVDGKYPNRPAVEPILHYQKKRGITLGIINGQGEEWYRQRVILSKKLLRPQELVRYIQPMNDVAEDFVKRLKKLSSSGSPVQNLEMELFKWSLETVGMMIFERRIGCFSDPPPPQAQKFIFHVIEILESLKKLIFSMQLYKIYPTKTWRIYERAMDDNIKIVEALMNKKLTAGEKHEVNTDDISEKSAFLTYLFANFKPEDAIIHTIDVLGGSVETISYTLLWVMYCLARNPESQDVLYKETMRLLADGEPVTEEKFQQMQYVKACLKETFRLYPVANSASRRISKDISVCGYHVPKGTHCRTNLYAMGRNKELHKDQMRFSPERWLRDTNEDASFVHLSNLTFGHGPRMCIGRRLAEQEIYITLSKIIQNFQLEFHGEDIAPTQAVFLKPDRPVQLKFIPRH